MKSLIGFAIKANKVIFGVDLIESSKRYHLIICCKSLSENSLKRLKKNESVKVIMLKNPLDEYVHKQNTKAIAIKDKQMANAILKFEDEYMLI